MLSLVPAIPFDSEPATLDAFQYGSCGFSRLPRRLDIRNSPAL